ncbi:MAG: phosphatidate cytidylyltransferase [Puniceicoccales bacterium]|jgi:phosphatidate cytidylyltransferase|nr:phosphatidate cytidylyltransferase [Puniceicoccales bacterium]
MLRRIFGTFLLLCLIALALRLFGNFGAILLLVCFTMGAQIELTRILQRLSGRVMVRQVFLWTLFIPLGSYYLPIAQGGIWLTLLAVLLAVIYGIARWHPEQLLTCLVPSIFSLLYVPFTLQFGALLLREGGESGLWLLSWVVAVSKLSDIGGLFIGIGCGRHSFACEYSPKKTWEGFFGGVALAALGGFFLCTLAHIFVNFCIPVWLSLPLAALLASVGAAGDLLESALKRLAKIKDSGHAIPGIGGCLDFCDTLTLSMPTAYIIMQIFYF